MNKEFIKSVAREAGCPITVVAELDRITLARELWEVIPKEHYSFFHLIKQYCYKTTAPLLPEGELTLLLITDDGQLL